jgi:hypothetical protein
MDDHAARRFGTDEQVRTNAPRQLQPACGTIHPSMIERDFDVSFVADLALREKQIQQNYRPIMAVHKWFARRPGTLFRALILSEFLKAPLRETFYQGQSLKGVRVLDPFMGGGTTLVEANRDGCAVTGFDINPMAWWIVRQEIGELLKAKQQGRETSGAQQPKAQTAKPSKIIRNRDRICATN